VVGSSRCGGYANPALSPTGQTIAVDTGWNSIALMDINGRHERLLVDDPNYGAWNPEFTPSGLGVMYTAYSLSGQDTDVFWMRTEGDDAAGADRQLVIGGPGDQEDADFSADGQRLAFISQDAPGDPYVLKVANADGSQQTTLNTSGQISGLVQEPKWAPDGTRIVFYARPVPRTWPQQPDDDYEIFTINADGTNLQRITNNNDDEYAPEWSPDGGKILYDGGGGYQVWTMSPDGSDARRIQQPVINVELDTGGDADGSWRRPSAWVDGREFQAAEFRPELLFDGGDSANPGEHWRPLEIEQFLGEGHQVCSSSSGAVCETVTASQDLRSFPAGGVLNVNGDGAETNYRSPLAECNGEILYDCDAGARSAIYWHSIEPSPGGYRYFDYWFFYRFNDVPDGFGDHEGDWENVSVAAAQTGSGLDTFDFATFSQHGHHFSYLRDNLSCDEGGKGTCGTEASREGKRLRVYVAAGSHANYAEPCGGPCTQSNSLIPEMDHDGEAPWGRNVIDPADSLFEFPAARATEATAWTDGPQNFTDWPGSWGTAASPGNQGSAFWRPWEGTQCADGSDCAVMSAKRRTRPQPSRCSDWLGAGVVAVACNPVALNEALKAGRLGRRGSFSVSTAGGRAVAAPGITQQMGGQLQSGTTLRAKGTMPGGTELLTSVRHRGRGYVARFALSSGLAGSAKLRVKAQAGARASSTSVPTVVLDTARGVRLEAASVKPVKGR
jgi:hypothetical protein